MISNSQNRLVCDKFELVRKLGSGSFGQIYLACNRENASQKYAAKLEYNSTESPQLKLQAKIYRHLEALGNFVGLPKLFQLSNENDFQVMLLQLLGPSVQNIFSRNNSKMPLKNALSIGYQMLERVRSLHQRQIIHRDLKPENFLMGTGKNSQLVYIIDFGLSRRYSKDGKHIPYKEGKQMTGTMRYASINNHMGRQQSRRDDIESIGYIIMYLIRGQLPWQKLSARDSQTKQRLVMQKKIATSAEELCKGYPNPLISFINYSRNLSFQQQPDYEYLLQLLNQAIQSSNQDKRFSSGGDRKAQTRQKITLSMMASNEPKRAFQRNKNSFSLTKSQITSDQNTPSKQPIRFSSTTYYKNTNFQPNQTLNINKNVGKSIYMSAKLAQSIIDANKILSVKTENKKSKPKSLQKPKFPKPTINPQINIKNNLNIKNHINPMMIQSNSMKQEKILRLKIMKN